MNSGSFFDDEVLSINEAVKHQIKREVDQAKIHLKDHVNTKDRFCSCARIVNIAKSILKNKEF
jgi:hypothetical protein